MKRLLLVLGLLGCASQPTKAPEPSARPRIHLGEDWFEHRAAYLGLTRDDAKRRDADIDGEHPPRDAFWDEQLAVESASLWRMLCNECHGGQRSIRRAKEMPGPPADWGAGEASFFGRRRPRQEIFRIIYHGVVPEEADQPEMPGWGERLAREQIWALVWFIEHASGDVYLSPPE